MKIHVANINYTLRHDLCTGCGLCSGACPSKAISTIVKSGRFCPSIDGSLCKNHNGCHRCFDVCPGLGVDFARLSSDLGQPFKDSLIGRYHRCYVGYSTNHDLRYHAASGGAVSQFLIWLIENKRIDGAIVTRFNKDNPLKVKSFIARTREEVLSAKSSKYAPVSFHEAIEELKNAPDGKYVVVGLPCHIQGFRKLEKVDKKLSAKVIGHFAIFCSASRTFNFTKYVLKERGINMEDVDYIAYRDRGNQGGLVVQGKGIDYYQDYRRYSHPLKSIFNPRRCLLCIDHYGELSDVSFGDINIPPYNEDKVGINSIIVRDTVWNGLLLDASFSGCMDIKEIDPSEINRSQPSAKMKKGRNLRFIYMLSKFGYVVPKYDIQTNYFTISDFVRYVLNIGQQFIGNNRIFWPVIRLLKKL